MTIHGSRTGTTKCQIRVGFWRVRIEDPEQRPIAGAIVTLVLSPDGAPIGAMRPAGTTDSAGIVEFHAMENGNYYADILAPGYAPKRVGTHQFEEATDGQSLDRRSLAIGHVLQGRIVGVERPVLEKTDLRVCDRWGSEWCIGLRTDGTFSLVVPAHEEVRLVARAPDHEYSTVSVRGKDHVMMKLAPIEGDSERGPHAPVSTPAPPRLPSSERPPYARRSALSAGRRAPAPPASRPPMRRDPLPGYAPGAVVPSLRISRYRSYPKTRF